MSNAQAIGGYFELDGGGGTSPLPDGVLLNSGRNALRHVVRKLGVKRILVPYYTCSVVWDALKAEGCELEFYEIGADFKPRTIFSQNDFVLYTNYFGCCGGIVDELVEDCSNLIVDCAQAYYASPKGRASFSSPRKFFGIPDGGVAYGVGSGEYDEDVSNGRMGHLIERREHGATPRGYELFRKAEDSLDDADVMEMSSFTRECLYHVDAQASRKRRLENFAYLHKHLPTAFPLALADDDVPMVYPYITDDPQLRKRLIDAKIYVASYWPGVDHCNDLRERILPLPIDQRYDEEDMKRIVEVIKTNEVAENEGR